MTNLPLRPDDLILVVDFEATCCDQGSIPTQEMEIIEVGACLAHPDGSVVDQFSCFVRPTLHPTLTPFCHGLLGIRQRDVDSAKTFEAAASMLREFVARASTRAVAWGSWGDFDRRQLDRECLRLSIPVPISLPHENLKRRFAKQQRIGKQVGMRKALALAELELQGVHHRALDDALNVARLLPCSIGLTSRTRLLR